MNDATSSNALWTSLLPPSQHGSSELCFDRAEGVRVTRQDGTSLLCGTSGLWNTNLGYGNAMIADRVSRAMARSSYLGIFRYENTSAREAAEALIDFAGRDQFRSVMFSSSGGAANDLVMKQVRQYHALRGEPQRKLVVGLRGGYHGLTFGSFAITDDDLGQSVYGVDRSLVRHVEINRISSLERLVSKQSSQIAAIIVEPLQGSGAVELSTEYLHALFRVCEENGILLVADEVATGFGRLGEKFASDAWLRRPDVLVASKALTNGTMSAAAVLGSHRLMEPFFAADAVIGHAETQAGTAVVAESILATLHEFDRLDALDSGRQVALWLDELLNDLLGRHPLVSGLVGRGCFRAVHISKPDGLRIPPAEVGALVAAIRRRGALVHPGPQAIQLIPALIYTRADLVELIGCVEAGLNDWSTACSE